MFKVLVLNGFFLFPLHLMAANAKSIVDAPALNLTVTAISVCLSSNTDLRCWPLHVDQPEIPKAVAEVPNTSYPRTLGSKQDIVCATDKSAVRCMYFWAHYNYLSKPLLTPNLVNPRLLSVFEDGACAVDDSGLRCWVYNEPFLSPDFVEMKTPVLRNARAVSLGLNIGCAIDDAGHTCWYSRTPPDSFSDIYTGFAAGMPLISNPKLVAAGYNSACAVDGLDELSCWYDKYDHSTGHPSSVVTKHRLTNPKSLVLGKEGICAIDNSGLLCWDNVGNGESRKTPTLVNPKLLAAGDGVQCAMDDYGITCWDWDAWNQYEVKVIKTIPLE